MGENSSYRVSARPPFFEESSENMSHYPFSKNPTLAPDQKGQHRWDFKRPGATATAQEETGSRFTSWLVEKENHDLHDDSSTSEVLIRPKLTDRAPTFSRTHDWALVGEPNPLKIHKGGGTISIRSHMFFFDISLRPLRNVQCRARVFIGTRS